MNSIYNKSDRKKYGKPEIEKIKLDNDISLVLQSDPPDGPGEEGLGKATDYHNSDPFNSQYA